MPGREFLTGFPLGKPKDLERHIIKELLII